MKSLSERIKDIRRLIDEADYILIGAGAGLSTAAGIDYGEERFKEYFGEFVKKYDMTDMYTSSFYPFDTQEEKWAYWSKHIYVNNVAMGSTELYSKLYQLVRDKNYFVITTNVDDQFIKSGFPSEKVFPIQGSYNYLQCSSPCHDDLYKNTELIKEMIDNIDDDLKVPTEMVPLCPKCGEVMDVNIRKDDCFVEDVYWHRQNEAYHKFINEARNHKCVVLEFGVGFNTPAIIRFPFESLVGELSHWNLVRFNRDNLEIVVKVHNAWKLMSLDMLEKYDLPNNFRDRYIPVSEDINLVIDELL